MKIEKDKLFDAIKESNIFPIEVEDLEKNKNDLEFSGDFFSYIEASKLLNGKILFTSHFQLSEDEFYEDEDNDERIDLSVVFPKLKSFKKYIGCFGQFEMATPFQDYKLFYTITEDWLKNFVEIREEALIILAQKQSEAETRLLTERQEEKDKLLKNLRGLLSDKKFLACRTQIIMREYALEKFPELIELSEHELKQEIQSLAARIEARAIK